jgi:hypothetical protein
MGKTPPPSIPKIVIGDPLARKLDFGDEPVPALEQETPVKAEKKEAQVEAEKKEAKVEAEEKEAKVEEKTPAKAAKPSRPEQMRSFTNTVKQFDARYAGKSADPKVVLTEFLEAIKDVDSTIYSSHVPFENPKGQQTMSVGMIRKHIEQKLAGGSSGKKKSGKKAGK